MMKKKVTIEGQDYILASSLPAEQRIRVLKHEEAFAVFDCYGSICKADNNEEGFYFEGTRFLSDLTFSLGTTRPLLLSSTISDNNVLLAVDLTNPDMLSDEYGLLPRGSVHICRSLFIYKNACYEELSVTNFAGRPLSIPLSYRFDADFADIFEIRGMHRARRGQALGCEAVSDGLHIAYMGLDRVQREVRILFDAGLWETTTQGTATKTVQLEAGEQRSFYVNVSCYLGEAGLRPERRSTFGYHDFKVAHANLDEALGSWRAASCRIETSNKQFSNWINRSLSDLFMMSSDTGHGLYPYAGVPWFSTTFGRDGLITALQTLWVNPQIARGVLAFLAANQAEHHNPAIDAEPGKILHEARKGEMANLDEIPFAKYYGGVDSTPLFIVLAGEYYRSTGDLEFIRQLWPAIERALNWIEEYGDLDGDGFVEYARNSPNGLINQGWKDSFDSVFHADGSDAEAPIALCEVQGYVYQARKLAAFMAKALGKHTTAEILLGKARELQIAFNRSFWCEELGMYALALDRNKQPCRVKSSNAGHCLFSGIATREHGQTLAGSLMGRRMFSGWGIRTIAEGEARYNPMSYHNGSIWPHDSSLIAMGLAQYGENLASERILSALFDAAAFYDLYRLPELFCGFGRRPAQRPVHYPMSCAPQAWAAGASFYLLQACLGLRIDGARQRLSFIRPVLPEALKYLRIFGLRVGDSSLDIEILRHGNGDIGIHLLEGRGDVKIRIFK